MKKILFLMIIPISLIYSCTKSPDYPIEPVIEFISINRTEVLAQTSPPDQNRNLDTLIITIGFTDGDGDIESDTTNVFFTDSRTGASDVIKISDIPLAGVNNGISGEIVYRFSEITCFPNSEPRDTLIYQIQMFDDAGNASNIIETPPIVLICD